MVNKVKQRTIIQENSVVERKGRKLLLAASTGKVGTTAGFVTRAANNTDYVTVPQSQTASTFVIPVTGLKVGDKITGFNLTGQIESAGGTVTVDAELRKSTAVAADPTDASIAAMTQLSVTADTKISASNASKTLSSPEVVSTDCNYYLLVTVTTGASCDVILQNAGITVTEQ